MLTCRVCEGQFERPGRRGPVPRYCSDACRAKQQRKRPERKEYERRYRQAWRATPEGMSYQRNYNQRPEVKERYRMRWHDDPAYRERQYALRRVPHSYVTIPVPYSGHMWLDMARKLVEPRGTLDDSKPWADDYHDDMGEALLALLEGRDPARALREYRKREFIPRRMTYHMGDWGATEEEQLKWFERVMPTVESAEEAVIDKESLMEELGAGKSVTLGSFINTPFHAGHGNRHMPHRTQQPSRRRMKDKSLRSHRT